MATFYRNIYHHKDGTFGLPIPNAKVRIAEDGEVLIRDAPVMLGYYKDAEATVEVLKEGWYATGDLGELDKDGFLTLIGRKKNLIILSNGENVSPEDLEADFLKDEAVQEVLVYAKEGMIFAEIYPADDYLDNEEYFLHLKNEINTLIGKNIEVMDTEKGIVSACRQKPAKQS